MASQEPLDEVRWINSGIAMGMGGIHTNSVLFYFARSQFFDPASNNGILESQALYNPSLQFILATREAFEGRLKTMNGLEFMVAQEPAETNPGAGTGVWVIRKQTRRKRPGEEDEITVHATYFLVGDAIFMAPSLADVFANKILKVDMFLNQFFSTASSLPHFSPADGHTWMPPKSSAHTKNAESQSQTGQNSRATTPLPDSLTSLNSNSSKKSSSSNNQTYLDNQLLDKTLNITWRYGDEYMDEIPITGQPGEFHLSSTGRKEKEKLLPPALAKGPLTGTGKAAPPALKTDIPPARKGSKSEKSPRTPGGPKRRKSKSGQGAVPGSAK